MGITIFEFLSIVILILIICILIYKNYIDDYGSREELQMLRNKCGDIQSEMKNKMGIYLYIKTSTEKTLNGFENIHGYFEYINLKEIVEMMLKDRKLKIERIPTPD